MAETGTTVGFVGLGQMGGNMAARFLEAGYQVYGHERSREHAASLEQQGLCWHDRGRIARAHRAGEAVASLDSMWTAALGQPGTPQTETARRGMAR